MGNELSVNKENEVKEITNIIENIHKLSDKLLEKYKKEFLNKDFCNKVDIVYQNKLSGLSIDKLKKINNKINNQDINNAEFDVYLKYDTKNDDRFIINSLKEELIDMFYKKVIDFHNDKIKLNIDAIDYIDRNRAMSGGLRELSGANSSETKSIIKNILEKRENDIIEINNDNNTNLEKNILFKQNIENIEKLTNKYNKKEKKELSELSKKELSELNKNLNLNDNKKENKKELSELSKILVNDLISKNNSRNKSKNNSNNNSIEFYTFPKCNNKTENCELTKKELCQAISKHFIVRSNIISAILTTLPKKFNDGFCDGRLKSLNSFKICLPAGFKDLEKMSKDKKIDEIIKYINNLDEKSCKTNNGYYRKLNEREINIFMESNNEFNILYKRFTKQLKYQYKDSLVKLENILNLLEKEEKINNKILNDISKNTKKIIDEMYSNCQTNYIYAILAFLYADIETTQKMREEERIVKDILQKELR